MILYTIRTNGLRKESLININDVIDKIKNYFELENFQCENSFSNKYLFETPFNNVKDYIVTNYIIEDLVVRNLMEEIDTEESIKFNRDKSEAINWYNSLTEKEKKYIKILNIK